MNHKKQMWGIKESHCSSVELHKARDDAVVLKGTRQVDDAGEGKFGENWNSKQWWGLESKFNKHISQPSLAEKND